MQNFLVVVTLLPIQFFHWLSNTETFQEFMVVMGFLVRKWYYWFGWLVLLAFMAYIGFSEGVALMLLVGGVIALSVHLIAYEAYHHTLLQRRINENYQRRWNMLHSGENEARENDQLC